MNKDIENELNDDQDNKNAKTIDSSIAFDRGNLILGIISLLAGALLGHLLPSILKVDGTPQDYAPLWLISAACVLLVFGVGAFVIMSGKYRRDSQSAVEELNKQVRRMRSSNKSIYSLVERTVSRQAALIPRDRIYAEMAQAFDDAESTISVVTLMAADWEKGERTWEPALDGNIQRDEFYHAIKKAIEREDVCYERIWQVPPEHAEKALDVLFTDPMQKEEFDLIQQYKKTNPHLAKFMISSILTTASFILIDGQKLFFNIDVINEETKTMESPYMLFIKDADGEVFDPLKAVVARFKPLATG